VKFYIGNPKWFGLPTNITSFNVIDFKDLPDGAIVPVLGINFRVHKIPLFNRSGRYVENRQVSVAVEIPQYLQLVTPPNYDRVVYPFSEGQPYYLLLDNETTIKLGKEFHPQAGKDFVIYLVIPPYKGDDIDNSMTVKSLGNLFEFTVDYRNERGWYLIYHNHFKYPQTYTEENINPDVSLPHGSGGFAFTVSPIPVTINELNGTTVQVMLLLTHDKSRVILPQYSNYDEQTVKIKGYGAFQLYACIYGNISDPYLSWWWLCVETPEGLKWIRQLDQNTHRPVVLRKAVYLYEPTFVREGSLSETTGIIQADFDFFSFSATSLDPIPLGKYIVVELPNGKKLVYRVTSMRKEVRPDGVRYRIEAVSPVEDETCCLPVSFSPNLFNLGFILRIGKYLSHFPREIYVPSDIMDIYLVDIEERRQKFSTLYDYLRFVFTYLSVNYYRQFALDLDDDFNLYCVEVTETEQSPPSNPISSWEENYDGLTPSVIIFGWNIIPNQTLMEERGIVFSSSEGRPVQRRFEVTYEGFVYLPLGTNVSGWGTVRNISWSVRPFRTTTKVVYVKYATV